MQENTSTAQPAFSGHVETTYNILFVFKKIHKDCSYELVAMTNCDRHTLGYVCHCSQLYLSW